MATRTWLTTPTGGAPEGEHTSDERWVPGPTLPVEPEPPGRYRGVFVMAGVLVAVLLLTMLVGGRVSEVQDPGIGGSDAGDQQVQLPGEGDGTDASEG